MTRRVLLAMTICAAASAAQTPNLMPQCERIAALLDQHRETGEPARLAEAAGMLAEVLAARPESFPARKLAARLLLIEGKAKEAARAASILNKQVPDDLELYGILADAHMQLGRMDEAERNIQWMLNMRPEEFAGRMRAARFRQLTGDGEGAIALLSETFHRIPSAFRADRSWVLARLAEIRLQRGEVNAALRLAKEAVRIAPSFPDAKDAFARASRENELRSLDAGEKQ
jgi:tetratricopeptide (TPR) repeat protein